MTFHRIRFASLVVVTSALVLGATSAEAFSSFRSRVPNGLTNSCRTCHTSVGGGEGWNSFGHDVLLQDPDVSEADFDTANENVNFNELAPDWTKDGFTLCETDSDGDGQSNGEELGDPNCIWSFTSPATPAPRTSDISNPGDPASTSANPTGVDPAGEGEGEGEGGEGEGEGEGAGEGEGEGEGEPPPGCCSSGNVGAPLMGLVGFVAFAGLRRRTRR
jgi:MYXO-CTERM domain-containing protein